MPAARVLRALPALFLCSLSLQAGVKVGPYFNGVFPNQAPGQTGWAVEDAFPNLSFTDPMWIEQVPGTEEMIVVEKTGRIFRFPRSAAATAAQRVTVLDLSAAVQTSEDQGFYRLAFHPQFGGTGPHADEVFACYSHRPSGTWRVSRFRWQHAAGTIDPASEEVLIRAADPHRWHNGGALDFDNEGFLLITCGDGGGANGQYYSPPSVSGPGPYLLGGVLRIDVDMDPGRSHPIRKQPASATTQGYYIPNDNPWQNPGQDRRNNNVEEFYAVGLRSPHSAHYDAETGELWLGDVGQNTQEELNRIEKGKNYGWPYREGTVQGPKNGTPSGSEGLPAYSYGRSRGGCIIAGMRYRGQRWAAELGGKVLFGDILKGDLSSYDPEGEQPLQELVPFIGDTFYKGYSNICTDAAGEIYLPKLNGQGQPGGKILILRNTGAMAEPPALLSQTGLFTNMAALTPAAAMMSYEVASPLWSDGAAKRRWIVLPQVNPDYRASHEKITWSATGNWGFPAGAVFVKHFEIATDARTPAAVKRLETRVMVCTANGGKYGLTYRWNAAGTDAVLLAGGEEEAFTVTDENGTPGERTWTYPSRANCMECHTEASGQALGLRAHQINTTVSLPGNAPFGQLAWFGSQDMFDVSLSEAQLAAVIEARAIDDETAPLEHRVRSYLDANCAPCHQPGGPVTHFDARLTTPLRNQGLVNEAVKGQFDLPGGCYIRAGDPALSAVHVRMAGTAPGVAMPPLGRHVVDEEAAGIIAGYIAGLTDAEFGGNPPGARPVRTSIAAPAHSSAAEFRVTVAFDTAVTDFTAEDLTVQGGAIVPASLRGSGDYYTVAITATQPQVSVSLAENMVSAGSHGSRASNTVTVTSGLLQPMTVAVTTPSFYSNATEVRLDFNQAYTHLDMDDFRISRGKLEWLIQEGNSARLIISRLQPNDSPSLRMRDGAALGANGLWLGKGFSHFFSSFTSSVPLLDSAAKQNSITSSSFYRVTDPEAGYPGSYYWLPTGSRGGVTTQSPGLWLDFSFTTPHAGDFRLRAWTRADSTASDSFYLRTGLIPGSSVLPWQTNQGDGEIGSLQFHEGFASPPGGAPHILQMRADSQSMTIYAAEDGTRISRMEIVPVRPFPLWEELPPTATELRAGLRFTSPVEGLSMDDFEVMDGEVTALEGSGRDYIVTVRPDGDRMYLAVKENAVTDMEFGGLGIASLPYVARIQGWTYADWASIHGFQSSDSNLDLDYDHDGMGMLLEFALGLDPQRPDVKAVVPGDAAAHGLPKLELEDGPEGKRLALVYHRRLSGTPMAYTVEFGDSPATLAPVEVVETVTPLGLQWEEVRAVEAAPPAGASARFGRLRVEKLPAQ